MIYSILRISGNSNYLSSCLEKLDNSLNAKINRKGYLVLDLSKNNECYEHIDEIGCKVKELSVFLQEIMGNIHKATIDIAISCPKNSKDEGLMVDVYHFSPELLTLIGKHSLHLEISNYE